MFASHCVTCATDTAPWSGSPPRGAGPPRAWPPRKLSPAPQRSTLGPARPRGAPQSEQGLGTGLRSSGAWAPWRPHAAVAPGEPGLGRRGPGAWEPGRGRGARGGLRPRRKGLSAAPSPTVGVGQAVGLLPPLPQAGGRHSRPTALVAASAHRQQRARVIRSQGLGRSAPFPKCMSKRCVSLKPSVTRDSWYPKPLPFWKCSPLFFQTSPQA